jgi:hypothetical protein
MVGLGLFVSACGGSSGEGVAQVGATQTTTTGSGSGGSGSASQSKRDALVAFSACMRENGVPDFPDPEPVDGGFGLSGVDPSSPGFRSAEETCRKLLPNGGRPDPQEQARRLRQALSYAVCMRRNGVSNFRDPKASGDGGIEWDLGPRSSVDPTSPRFKAAEKACGQLLPGAARPYASGSRNAG